MPNFILTPTDIERRIRDSYLQEHPELKDTEFSVELVSAEYPGAIAYMRCSINWVEEEPDDIDIAPLTLKARLTARDYEKVIKP